MELEQIVYRSLLALAGAITPGLEPMLSRLVRGCFTLTSTGKAPYSLKWMHRSGKACCTFSKSGHRLTPGPSCMTMLGPMFDPHAALYRARKAGWIAQVHIGKRQHYKRTTGTYTSPASCICTTLTARPLYITGHGAEHPKSSQLTH